MSNNPRNVRQKTDDDTLHITSLPDGFLVNVSEYLPKPSKAMLAVALSARATSWNVNLPSDASRAIVLSEQWDILDFEEIDKELANKLTDDDIYAVLKCISSQDVLKRLKLCVCVNITGMGLYPLRGSLVLEQIDLSLVGKHDRPEIEPTPKISQEIVLPILDSIISADGCSLKHIQFPKKWRVGHQENELLTQFQGRYNAMFRSRSNSCSHCNVNMRDHENWMRGLQNNVCYDCLKLFCSGCSIDEDEDGDGDGILDYCCICKKDYCQNCIHIDECAGCAENICRGCDGEMRTCDECDNTTCKDCVNICGGCNRNLCRNLCEDCSPFHRCQGDNCDKAHCEECYNGKEYSTKYCEECGNDYCRECKLEKGHSCWNSFKKL